MIKRTGYIEVEGDSGAFLLLLLEIQALMSVPETGWLRDGGGLIHTSNWKGVTSAAYWYENGFQGQTGSLFGEGARRYWWCLL